MSNPDFDTPHPKGLIFTRTNANQEENESQVKTIKNKNPRISTPNENFVLWFIPH